MNGIGKDSNGKEGRAVTRGKMQTKPPRAQNKARSPVSLKQLICVRNNYLEGWKR